jgi:hypothetical protein
MSLSPGVTMLLATALWTFLRAWLFGSAAIALENLALRHQLVPDRDADAPSRPESPAGSGPGWQNWQMDGRVVVPSV